MILHGTGILFAMLLAAFLGNYIAQLSTSHIDNGMVKFIAGILVGLLVGMAVGFLVKRTWEKFSPLFSKTKSG